MILVGGSIISALLPKHIKLWAWIFKDNSCTETRKCLYISIVRSKLLYCSPLWKPYLLSDIDLVKKVQRRATKYIVQDYISEYKQRLIKLRLLPIIYIIIRSGWLCFFYKITEISKFKVQYFKLCTIYFRSNLNILQHQQTVCMRLILTSFVYPNCGIAYLLLTYPNPLHWSISN